MRNLLPAASHWPAQPKEAGKSGQSARLSFSLISPWNRDLIFKVPQPTRTESLLMNGATTKQITGRWYSPPTLRRLLSGQILVVQASIGWDPFQLTRERYLIAIDPPDINNCINWVPQKRDQYQKPRWRSPPLIPSLHFSWCCCGSIRDHFAHSPVEREMVKGKWSG